MEQYVTFYFIKISVEAIEFNNFLGKLKHKHKIIIPGNHENFPDIIYPFLTNCTYFLLDHIVEIEGIKIYGSRFKSKWHQVFFMNDKWAKQYWDDTPKNIDIFLSHQPAKGFNDGVKHGESRGNEGLKKKLLEIKPKVHLYGHVHEEYSKTIYTGDTTIICAAQSISKKKKTLNVPIVFDLIVKEK